MRTIADEIRDFLASTGHRQAALSVASGVPPSTLSNLLKGRRKGVHGTTQDALRNAMLNLATPATHASTPASSAHQDSPHAAPPA